MTKLTLLISAVLGMLLVERLTIILATRSPRGCAWIRGCRLLHPNTISFIRMPMGVISVLLWHFGSPDAAMLWFAGWMITDLTDGTIARNCGLETPSGKWLDPLSDKCMYVPPLLYFSLSGPKPLLSLSWVVALIGIDLLGQASRLFSKKKAANSFGKAKTALITILLSLVALQGMGLQAFMHHRVLLILTMSCTVLAFLSLYCKVIPDNWYANSLTLANFLCGAGAICQVATGHPVRAFVLVFLGQFFDLFDGRMARKFGSTRYGAIYDDIADGTSFGLAIGVLILSELGGGFVKPGHLLNWGAITPAGWVVAVSYVVCVVYRLIRFLKPSVQLAPGIFQGFPSPAGAMLAGAAALFFADKSKWAGMGFVVAAAVVMISSIRYRHFGQKIWPSLPNPARLLVFVFFLLLANVGMVDRDYRDAFSIVCFAMSLVYAALGVEWKASPPAAAPKETA